MLDLNSVSALSEIVNIRLFVYFSFLYLFRKMYISLLNFCFRLFYFLYSFEEMDISLFSFFCFCFF